ncbi:MAG: SDR family oxidoreductase [Segetibacter sp.]
MEANNQNQTIMVVGSTGFLGMEICRRLLEANKQVKGLVRASSDETKVAALKQMGVETVVGDVKDKTSLDNGFKGVYAVISTASSTLSRQEGDSIETVDNAGQLNVVEAAINAGVKHFVFVSFNHIPVGFPLQTAKRAVENRIRESGMSYTILQPTVFMEVWLGPALGFDYFNAKANIFGDGKNKISWISLADVAAFAVASLDNAEAINAVFELGGPDALSPLEVVKIFEEKSGKSFSLQFVPKEALKAQKEAATDSLSESFAGLMMGCAEGSEIDMNTTLKTFPFKLTSVREYAQRVLG